MAQHLGVGGIFQVFWFLLISPVFPFWAGGPKTPLLPGSSIAGGHDRDVPSPER